MNPLAGPCGSLCCLFVVQSLCYVGTQRPRARVLCTCKGVHYSCRLGLVLVTTPCLDCAQRSFLLSGLQLTGKARTPRNRSKLCHAGVFGTPLSCHVCCRHIPPLPPFPQPWCIYHAAAVSFTCLRHLTQFCIRVQLLLLSLLLHAGCCCFAAADPWHALHGTHPPGL